MVCYAAVDPGFANGKTAAIGTAPGMYPWSFLIEGFGGSITGEVQNTNITIDKTANLITQMHGGSKTGAVNGGTNLVYNGNSNIDFKTATTGYGIYQLYGGSKSGIVGSGTHLTMNSGWLRGWIVGGGFGTVDGDSIVDVNGGLVGATVKGASNINLKHIIADNPSIEHFTGAILPGNAEQDVNVNFMNYHGFFNGSIGSPANQTAILENRKRLGEVKIYDYSKVVFAGGKTYD